MSRLHTFAIRDSLATRDLAILSNLQRFRLLSTRQIQRLHFPYPGFHSTTGGATRATHRVLQRLQNRDLVEPLSRRVGGPERGSAAALWQLADVGARVLQLGQDEPKRNRYREPSSSLFVRHTVAVAEAAVAITEAARARELELLALEAEPTSWRSFLGEAGQPESLRPDLYVVIANQSVELHAFVEIDMATEHAPQILRKCQLYGRYANSGSAEQQLGVVPQVMWVAPTTARRDAIGRMIATDPRLPPSLFTVVTSDEAAPQLVASLADSAEESDDTEPAIT